MRLEERVLMLIGLETVIDILTDLSIRQGNPDEDDICKWNKSRESIRAYVDACVREIEEDDYY